MNETAPPLLMAIIGEGAETPTETLLGQLDDAIKRGADINATDRSVHHFGTALSEAALQAREPVVRFLLDHGALVHWPGEEEIDQVALAGSHDNAYEGMEVDPLGLALCELGWLLAEESMTPEDDGYEEKLRACLSIAQILMEAGADALRPDPARGRTPLEAFLLTLCESQHSCEHHSMAIGELLVRMVQSNPELVADAANGKFNKLGIGWFRPGSSGNDRVAAKAMQMAASAHLLATTTPHSPTSIRPRI